MDLGQIHEVHGSQLKSFRGCRLRWQWQYVDGYSPIVRPAPLEFGTAFHIGMETLYNPETWTLPLIDLYRIAKETFLKFVDQQVADYLERKEAYALDPEEEVDYEELKTLGVGMLRLVARTMDRKNYRPIAVEAEAFAPIMHPATGQQLVCECGKPYFYGVRPDAVLVDLNGRYWLVDWKTTSMLLRDQMILELDGQIATYLWALVYALGLDFAGFYYVQIFKGFPKRPQLLVYPRLGRKFSISHNQRTDPVIYSQVVSKQDPVGWQLGLYEEYMEWLKEFGPDFIKWFKVYKSPAQLRQVGIDLADQVIEMNFRNPTIYPNPGRMQCQRCPFQEPCLERQSGNDPHDTLNSSYERLEPYYVRQRILREERSA